MITMETRNAISMPVPRRISSPPEKRKPYLTILRRLAPAMTGIARIKVNLAATVRETPISSPPTMVAPEREVPGKIAAISWKMPIRKASLKVRSRSLSTLGTLFLLTVSIIMKAIPTMIRAAPTTIAL